MILDLFADLAGFSSLSINTSILKCTYFLLNILVNDNCLVCLSLAVFTMFRHDIFNHMQILKKDKSKLLENSMEVQI